MEKFKTYFLMIGLTLLFIWFGGLIGGKGGMILAFLIAAGMNFYAYYYSDKQVLAHYHAIPLDESNAPQVYRIVEDLTRKAGLPMPKLYIIPDPVPNAFATGRDYEHAAVAVTEGLLDLLNEEEVAGVIAHELSHIKHYDMLIGTVAATIAGAISMLANFGMFFGGRDEERNPIVTIALMIIMPLAATIIQMTISRSREFEADKGAALITGHPEWLQSALSKLDNYARRGAVIHDADPSTAHMFIVNPFSGLGGQVANLFRTHPTTEERIERLEEIKYQLRRA
ncbi:zinc metalloprotease HtpX [Nitratifractor salsuginis]|uniref:Protease HtpX homolog n=1 Tax=Nitratifractor salsuginis (strain DSM 16511 / JCM 12458 / E9I37-1) TaxID=749222 RepID=E6WZZ0_NITSE|nr:zinc metalloprotease HtpX [Nitratifractor salsuginis]ADV45648.1 Heat shock protein [Nitratifractor salsuginis DSM 16511]